MPQTHLKNLLRSVPGLTSGYHQVRILAGVAAERWCSDPALRNDRSHLVGEWNFESPAEQERHERILEAARSHLSGTWADALEIGCADGVFTRRLAESCRTVTACDISAVACGRAAARLKQFSQVRVERLDIAADPIAGAYDLVFANSVVSFVHGRARLDRVVKTVADSLRSNGILVFNETLLPLEFGDKWWARSLVEGGLQHVRFIDGRHGLELIRQKLYRELNGYIIAIFRKVAGRAPTFTA